MLTLINRGERREFYEVAEGLIKSWEILNKKKVRLINKMQQSENAAEILEDEKFQDLLVKIQFAEQIYEDPSRLNKDISAT